MRQNPTQQTVLMLEERSWRDASTVCSREGTGLLQGEGTAKQVKAGVGRTKWGGNTNKACHWFRLVLLGFQHLRVLDKDLEQSCVAINDGDP